MPTRPETVPNPPKEFDKKAKAVWRRLATLLWNCGILADSDLPLLKRYCLLTVDYDNLRQDISLNGLLDPEGNPRPSLMQQNKLVEQMLKIERELGMTPSSRSQVKAIRQPGSNEEADFD